jgi:hypothetical protein
LSLHADGDLPSGERELIETHLATCEACRGLLRDLDRLRRAASSLGPVTPPDHVWLQVAGRMRIERPDALRGPARRERRAAMGQWMGLAAALVLITAGGYFFVRTTPANPPVSNAVVTPTVQSVADGLTKAMNEFNQVIADLERLTAGRDSQLDPVLANTLKQNIQVIEAAIESSQTALLQNPGNELARESLFDAFDRKVTVLRATVNLMNEMRKGNQAGAGEAADALRKKS